MFCPRESVYKDMRIFIKKCFFNLFNKIFILWPLVLLQQYPKIMCVDQIYCVNLACKVFYETSIFVFSILKGFYISS